MTIQELDRSKLRELVQKSEDDLRQEVYKWLEKKEANTSDKEHEKNIKTLVDSGDLLFEGVTKPVFFRIFKTRVEDMDNDGLLMFLHDYDFEGAE